LRACKTGTSIFWKTFLFLVNQMVYVMEKIICMHSLFVWVSMYLSHSLKLWVLMLAVVMVRGDENQSWLTHSQCRKICSILSGALLHLGQRESHNIPLVMRLGLEGIAFCNIRHIRWVCLGGTFAFQMLFQIWASLLLLLVCPCTDLVCSHSIWAL
jgi:hypothetical protein